MRIGKLAGNLIFFTLIGADILLSQCTLNHSRNQVERTNVLNQESSPYLLQHANNPVHWQAWGKDALNFAQKEDMLILVSIGYSSCHWCHVMEHECFEDSATAELMNKHFVSIKVDREERPDVDQIYMTALQLMTGQGGWPLNVICLPDGRPVWGATYLPRDKWKEALKQLAEIYQDDSAKMHEYAEKLREGIQQSELLSANKETPDFSQDDARKMFNTWSPRFDTMEGGPNRAPKFPMPVNQLFLLELGILDQNTRALEQNKLTLDKIAAGGIYDQIGGGFARYSTDARWVVPHFEKMLYDNAQLLSLYAQAYRHFGDDTYLRVIKETLNWLDTEMTGDSGQYYSALDADSDGEEGKYYVWTEAELKSLIPEDEWSAFTGYFDLEKGRWEQKIILTRKEGSSVSNELLSSWRTKLYSFREQRNRPGLDDKSLTSWNALMISALVDVAKALYHSEPVKAQHQIERAARVMQWISEEQSLPEHRLYHSSRLGKPAIEGLLEDYAFSIKAALDLFEYTSDPRHLELAINWLNRLNLNFLDSASGLYYTRSLHRAQLISKSLDRVDNVIPSPNSVMAHNLWRLSHLTGDQSQQDQAMKMLNQISKDRLMNYAESYANWGSLLLRFTFPSPEVVITGSHSKEYYLELHKQLTPNSIWIWSEEENQLPLIKNRVIPGQTTVYVCENNTCQLPVKSIDEALAQIQASM